MEKLYNLIITIIFIIASLILILSKQSDISIFLGAVLLFGSFILGLIYSIAYYGEINEKSSFRFFNI
ncbi:MAG: hypothetical protein PHF86_14115 [Candidatus Nanoarchaeia archaeon]|jgi:hypothetical protein|nr:hypothetical protein [Candidatus Nanoarchaeia archaeon]